MYEFLADAAITAAAFCWLVPVVCLALMFVAIVIRGEPEPPKDGGQ